MTTRAIKVKGEQVSFLAHADSAEQLITGAVTGETGTAGRLKVKDTYVYWIDNAGDERRRQGTLTGETRTAGSITVHGEDLYYGDDDGDERYLRAIVTLELGTLKDSWISDQSESQNFGTDIDMWVRCYLTHSFGAMAVLAFDVTALAGKTISSATLRLAFFASSAEGRTHWVYKLLHNDWVETEISFDEKKSGTTWTSGDFSSSDFETSSPAGASEVVPDLVTHPWIEWDITAIVQDAIDNSINVNTVVMGESPVTAYPTVRYDSKEASAEADRPKLTVVYED